MSRINQDRIRALSLPRLFALHPLAVITEVGFLDTRTLSSSVKFRSFLLSMCIDAPESKMALVMTKLLKANRKWLCPFL